MNDYILIGTDQAHALKYRTPAKTWKVVSQKPMNVRWTLVGSMDATYAPVSFNEWDGQIEGPVTPDDGTWGVITDLRTILAVRGPVFFQDHYGKKYTIHAQGPFDETSMSQKWDSPSNVIFIGCRLIKASDIP